MKEPQPGFKPFGFSAWFNAQPFNAQILNKIWLDWNTRFFFSNLNNSEIFVSTKKFKLRKFQAKKHTWNWHSCFWPMVQDKTPKGKVVFEWERFYFLQAKFTKITQLYLSQHFISKCVPNNYCTDCWTSPKPIPQKTCCTASHVQAVWSTISRFLCKEIVSISVHCTTILFLDF